MPFNANLVRYLAELASERRLGTDESCVQLVSLHQIAEQAFVKLYEMPHELETDCDTLALRLQFLNDVAPVVQGHGE